MERERTLKNESLALNLGSWKSKTPQRPSRRALFYFYPTSYQKPQVVDCEASFRHRQPRSFITEYFVARRFSEWAKENFFPWFVTWEVSLRTREQCFFHARRLNYREIIFSRLCFIIGAIVCDPSGFNKLQNPLWIPSRLLHCIARLFTRNLAMCQP